MYCLNNSLTRIAIPLPFDNLKSFVHELNEACIGGRKVYQPKTISDLFANLTTTSDNKSEATATA